jgi:hypothetical protein
MCRLAAEYRWPAKAQNKSLHPTAAAPGSCQRRRRFGRPSRSGPLPPAAVGELFSLCENQMTREIHIQSYFSLPTDLAGQMRNWPEFLSGAEYSVQLKNAQTGEVVEVSLVEPQDERPYVSVKSPNSGSLFDRVLGKVVYALSEHSDDLIVDRYA